MHRSLSRGIAATHDVYVFAAGQRRLARTRAVVHTCAAETRFVWQFEQPVRDTCRAHDRACRDPRTVFQIDDTVARREIRAHAGTGQQDFRAEPDCLIAGPLGELRPADTVWKPQVVFDLRSAAGLPTDGPALHQDSA